MLLLVAAQFCGASLWFSPNAAAADLIREWNLGSAQIGQLTSSVLLGFIAGTLILAITGVADRVSGSKFFATSCFMGGAAHACFALWASDFAQGLAARFLVGVCLAGIYPVGLKLVIRWSGSISSRYLDMLLGMITLGTALPHAIRALGANLDWRLVCLSSSALAVAGGLVVLCVGDPDPVRSAGAPPPWHSAFSIFKRRDFRACALGYFGHMWELYAFWTVAPTLVLLALRDAALDTSISLSASLTFLVIASGAVGCQLASSFFVRQGSARTAALALTVSGLSCLLYPWVAGFGLVASLVILCMWGMSVIPDSAHYSLMSSQSCPSDFVASALAIQNSVGFLVAIVSINVVSYGVIRLGPEVSWLLVPGPAIGLLALMPLLRGTITLEGEGHGWRAKFR